MAIRIGTGGSDILNGTASNDVLIGDPQRSSALILASSTAAGVPGNYGSSAPRFSPDGRSVVFISASYNLVPNDANAGYNVYLKDLVTGEIRKVSETSSGGYAAGSSDRAHFTPDGQKVVFQSAAYNLVSGDTNGKIDLFMKDLFTGALTRLTTSTSGVQANDDSGFYSISNDGTKIIFDSNATNLVSGDTNAATDVFMRDLTTGVVTRVSTSSTGAQADEISRHGVFSPDGNSIVFESYASNLVSGHLPGADIYLKNLATGAISEISTNAAGVSANGNCENPFFSADGNMVAFESAATNLVSGVPSAGETRLYIKNLVTGTVTLASSDAVGQPLSGTCSGGAFSLDGTLVMVTQSIGTTITSYIKNLVTGQLQTISNPFGNGAVVGFEFAPDGSGYSFYAYNGAISQAYVQITEDLGAGADSLNGGDGFDIASYETAKAAVKIDLRVPTGLANLGDALGDTYTSIEYFYLSDFADTFIGGNNNDIILGSGGGDNIDGGAGAGDYVDYFYSGAAVTVNLTLGTGLGGKAQGDSYTNIENVAGSDYADTLIGNASNNLLDGWLGSDVMTGGDGNDVYYANVVTDTVIETNANATTGGADSVFFEGTSGNYVLTANVEVLELIGTSAINGTGNEIVNDIYGNAAANVLDGRAGNDYIDGGADNDSIYGGLDNDLMIGGGGADFLDGGDGTDTASYETSAAGVRVDMLFRSGNTGDSIGDAFVSIEVLKGSGFNDILYSTEGNDTVTGGNGLDLMWTRGGNDILKGEGGNDSMYGRENDDRLIGGAGMDYMDGGDGFDTVSYEDSVSGVIVDLVFRSGNTGDAVGDSFVGLEALTGSNFNDRLTGTTGNDTITGLGGQDYINARAGSDTLYGGADNDQIYAGDGNDYLEGGSGGDHLDGGNNIDTAGYLGSTLGVQVDMVNQATNTNDAAGDFLSLIENLFGSALDDRLLGSEGDNTLTGHTGADMLWARGGNDKLYGGDGIDTLFGVGGNDLLAGGTGNDALDGGTGADIFRFDTALGTTNVDTIADFTVVDDTIQLENTIFTGFITTGALAAGNLSITGSAAGTLAQIVYSSATGTLAYDADGSNAGAAITFANIGTGKALTLSDFDVT